MKSLRFLIFLYGLWLGWSPLMAQHATINREHYFDFSLSKVYTFHYWSPENIEIKLSYLGMPPEDDWLQSYMAFFQEERKIDQEGEEFSLYHFTFHLGQPGPCPVCEHNYIHGGKTGLSAGWNEYNFTVPRFFMDETTPTWMHVETLKNIIKQHKIAMICGSEMAALGGVLPREKFVKKLGIDFSIEVDSCTQAMLTNPLLILNQFAERCQIGYTYPPSVFHWQLAQIAKVKNCPVLKADFDCFLEKTGIPVFDISKDEIQIFLMSPEFAQIEYFLCFGIDADDRGILAYYKAVRPQGRIIAIHPTIPAYLGNEDFIVLDHLENVIPHLSTN